MMIKTVWRTGSYKRAAAAVPFLAICLISRHFPLFCLALPSDRQVTMFAIYTLARKSLVVRIGVGKRGAVNVVISLFFMSRIPPMLWLNTADGVHC